MKKLVQLTNKDNENMDPINLNYEKRLIKLENDVYSTEEVKTNRKWIDGKPIYRKIIAYTGERLEAGRHTIKHNISNIGSYRAIISSSFMYNGDMWTGVTSTNNYAGAISFNSTEVALIVAGWDKLFSPVYVTLEYTKTTD